MRKVRLPTPPLARQVVVVAASLGVAVLCGAPLGGQAQEAAPGEGLVAGVVHDAAGNEIASVEVTVPGTPIRVLSDGRGAFLLRHVPLGPAMIRLRRLGFVPRTLEVRVDTVFSLPVDVALETLPIRLATIQVRAARRVYTGYMADFNRRKDSNNGGRFITREQIDSLRPYRTTDLLRRIPGMSFTPMQGGSSTAVRVRGQRCAPLIWIDGTPAASAYFDPDLIDPRAIAGIEIYSGIGTVPPALTGPMMTSACGTVAIWTRIPDPRPKRPKGESMKGDPRHAALRLAALVDSLQVYTVSQVDQAAALDTLAQFAPLFPDELRRSRQAGLVVAEFVVDADGHVEPATVGVVTSTHPLFTAAVDSALSGAVFTPAVLAGRAVRQLVQLPVHFVPPGTSKDD